MHLSSSFISADVKQQEEVEAFHNNTKQAREPWKLFKEKSNVIKQQETSKDRVKHIAELSLVFESFENCFWLKCLSPSTHYVGVPTALSAEEFQRLLCLANPASTITARTANHEHKHQQHTRNAETPSAAAAATTKTRPTTTPVHEHSGKDNND